MLCRCYDLLPYLIALHLVWCAELIQRAACIATRIALTTPTRIGYDNIYVTNNKYNMRKFSNVKSVVIMKHAFVGFQIVLTSLAVIGFMRVLIGLIVGDFNNVSFAIY